MHLIKKLLYPVLQRSSILVGGQAVIEGVMMRVPGAYATAVRRADGEIVYERRDWESLAKRYRFLGLPLIRGVVSLFEAMKIGMGSLQYSADMAEEGEIPETRSIWSRLLDLGMTLFAFALALGLFFVLPLWLTTAVFSIEESAWAFNLVSGGFRIVFFLLYLLLISLMKDVRRLFQYHGAEHKTIYAFEDGRDMEIADIRPYTTLHPRCGTSFLFISLVTAILIYAVIDSLLIYALGELTLKTRLLWHLPMIPLVMGFGYEGIKFTSRHITHPLVGWMTLPGLWLQRITTKEPDDSMLEVALTSLKVAFGDEWENYRGGTYQADAIE